MIKLRQVAVLPRSQLETLPTKVLLGRLRRLRECEESALLSDLDYEEITSATGILWKESPEWKAAFDDVKAVLATREHVVRKPESRDTENVPANRLPLKRRRRLK